MTVNRRHFLRFASTSAVGVLLAACGGTAAPSSSPAAASPSNAAPKPSTAAPASTSAAASAKPAASASVATPSSPAASASAAAAPASSATAGGVKLPSYIPVQGPKPDLPGSADGIDPGYLAYPKNLFKSVPNPPGSGGDVSVFTWLITQPPTPMDQNAAWQEINKQLNAKMNLTLVAFADLNTKFSTLMAGSELPDMFLVPLLNTVQQLPQFLASKCADLTPYLGGDAVKDYPNLANIPTLPWRSTVYNGSIFGVPTTISAMNTATFVNANLWSAAGAGDPKSGDDFKKILQELTKAPAGQYGIGSAGAPGAATRSFFQGMFGSPNNWKLGTDGKLTKDYELDSSKAAVGYVRDLVSAGVWHPDSATFNLINGQSNFIAGKMATWGTGWPNYPIMWEQGLGQKPQVKIHALKPFGADGGKGTHYLGAAFYGMMALKKAPDARIKELLRILNWLAAPFGSQESQLIDYGVKDTDFTYDDKGNPVLTAKGKQDTLVSWNEIGGRPPVLFDPNSPEFAQTAHADETALVPLGVLDPTIGFYSETNQAKGASINSTLSSGIADIVTGRRPMSDYDQLVKDWRNAGGDQIRSELEKAMAAAKK